MKSNRLLHSKEAYAAAIKKLFPLGTYWERQFDNPQSDLSLWVEAKAEELYRFKSGFTELVTEASPKTADGTLDDWERVLVGKVSSGLPAQLRRDLLAQKRRGFVNRQVLQDTAALFAVKIKRAFFPFRSAFCGHTRIAINRMCSPASFSVLFIQSEMKNPALRGAFEQSVIDALPAHMIVYFFYN